MDSIGKRISKARRILDINQKELCKRAGITEASLSRYENDLREPKSAVLARLSVALEVPPEYLLGMISHPLLIDTDAKEDVSNDLCDIISNTESLLHGKNLSFHGKPASKEAVEALLNALEMGMLLADKKQKDK